MIILHEIQIQTHHLTKSPLVETLEEKATRVPEHLELENQNIKNNDRNNLHDEQTCTQRDCFSFRKHSKY